MCARLLLYMKANVSILFEQCELLLVATMVNWVVHWEANQFVVTVTYHIEHSVEIK